MKVYLLTILSAYIVTRIFGYWLKALNLGHLKRHGADIPPEFENHVDAGLLKKIRDYTVENSRFSMFTSVVNDGILVVFLFGGLMDVYNTWVLSLEMGFILTGIVFFFLLAGAETVISVPFSLYRTFKIENKYGFNTTTFRLWLTDLLKSVFLSALLTGVLISAGLWLVTFSPDTWWLWVWIFFFAFSLFVMYVSPYVIEPLFNRFTPVDDKTLEDRVRDITGKAGIKAGRIFSMDASKRSRHTNAYFTGMGKVKRIVLYDTLLSLMERDEVIAVLAHEIGHWKKRHVLKRMIISEAVAIVVLYVSFRILGSDLLLRVFSIEQGSFFAKVVLLAFIGGIIAFPLSPLSNYFSRRQEKEADRFACRLTGNPESVRDSLVKLSKDNLSNLHPHPLYAAFYYSHPPVLQRIREIGRQ